MPNNSHRLHVSEQIIIKKIPVTNTNCKKIMNNKTNWTYSQNQSNLMYLSVLFVVLNLVKVCYCHSVYADKGRPTDFMTYLTNSANGRTDTNRGLDIDELDFPRNPLNPPTNSKTQRYNDRNLGRNPFFELTNKRKSKEQIILKTSNGETSEDQTVPEIGRHEFNGGLNPDEGSRQSTGDSHVNNRNRWFIKDIPTMKFASSSNIGDIGQQMINGGSVKDDYHRRLDDEAGYQAPPPHGPLRPPVEPYTLSWVSSIKHNYGNYYDSL